MRRMQKALVGIVGLFLLGQAACFGPITATKEISDAEGALERARIADAHEKAPYYYYSAENFLHKAKEEWGYSDFQAADKYAQEAIRFAKRALSQSKEDPWPGSPVTKEKLEKLRIEKGIDIPKKISATAKTESKSDLTPSSVIP